MKTLYVENIINISNNTVKIDGLKELLKRINDNSVYDKVGNIYYKIVEDIKFKKIPTIDNVIKFLNDINARKSTKKIIGYTNGRIENDI